MKIINGDNPGNILNRLLYFYQCIKNHKKGKDLFCRIDRPKLIAQKNNTDINEKTPARLICDIFWNSINYEDLKLQLNSGLNFFDIGCGSGRYGKFLEKICNSHFENYTGLDVYKNSKYPKKYNHIKDTANNVNQHINKKINFVISQSALEHVENDIFVIEEVTKKLCENNHPYIQIHMIPATRCLWLYLWHGYRQYSKKNLANISFRLNKKYKVNTSIIPLGGNHCFWAQFKYVTLPLFIKKKIFKIKNFKLYEEPNIKQKIFNQVTKDLNCNHKNPIFWALIISPKNINIKFHTL